MRPTPSPIPGSGFARVAAAAKRRASQPAFLSLSTGVEKPSRDCSPAELADAARRLHALVHAAP